MITTTAIIFKELEKYASPADKLTRMVKDGRYIPIVKGLYETNKNTPGYLLDGSIYGPSYLSFEFALACYGLIPEAVYTCTSATFEKKKIYSTPFGVFTYHDIPSGVYNYGLKILSEGEYSYLMVTPEKALCDQLYKTNPIHNYRELQDLLFEDLRIDEEELLSLNQDDIVISTTKYGSTNVNRLSSFMRRIKGNE